MYFHGFAIEILEDGKQLREYCLQEKHTRIATGRSYVTDEKTNERKYSPITVYAVVKETGKKFEIKYSAKLASDDNPIIAIIYVDGINDCINHVLTSSLSQIENSFWDFSRDKKYYFEFSKTSHSPESSPNSRIRTKPLYGARGTISIYFYRGLKVPERLKNMPYYSLNQSSIIDPKFKSEINIVTKFNEINGRNISPKPIVDIVKQSNDPIAVLHVHYRSESWLISIGMPIRKDNEKSSTECTPNNSSFKSVPTRDRNVLAQNEQGENQPMNENDIIPINQVCELDQSLIEMIQSFEKIYNNEPVDVIEIQDDKEVRVRSQKKRKKKQKHRKKKKKEKREVANTTSINNEIIMGLEETSNPEEPPKTNIPKYKEYIEREYHTSDYIELDDEQDQILKKKTYYVEKTIIDLDD